MRTLTWYPGTILPYASMWHTLMRATWLNKLHQGEIRELSPARKQARFLDPRERAVLDLKAIAAALGERYGALPALSLVQHFPPVLRGDLTDRSLRWCPRCIQAGYHTLLGSIMLVSRCPIHDERLLDACPHCNGRMPMQVQQLSVRPPSCGCGKSRFIDPRTVRIPDLTRQATEAWTPVAKWVRQVGGVGFSRSTNSTMTQQNWVALAPRWCRDLGIAYPGCFDSENDLCAGVRDGRLRWTTSYRASSGDLREAFRLDSASQSGSPGFHSPPEWVYRAMARHLRRHGLPNPDQSIKCLVQARDDRQVAIRMAKHPRSAAAFTEMMWSQRLDPTTVLRRWPTRVDHAHRITNMLRYAERTSDPFIAATQWHENVNAKSVRWVQYHAMAMEASLAWSRAWQQARKSIDDRRADWMFEALRKGDRHGKGVVTWFCRTKGRGAVFVGYIHGVDRQPFTAGMPTKQERTAKTEAIRRARQGSVEPLVKHPCLRWDNRHGWHVAQGAFPDDGDIRRKRLLHCGPRTSCWVFTSAGRFVARLDGGQIEASGETASEALNGLRRAVVQYRQTYEPHNAVQPVPSKDGDPHRAAVADAGSAKCPNPRDGVDRHGLDARAESRVGGIG